MESAVPSPDADRLHRREQSRPQFLPARRCWLPAVFEISGGRLPGKSVNLKRYPAGAAGKCHLKEPRQPSAEASSHCKQICMHFAAAWKNSFFLLNSLIRLTNLYARKRNVTAHHLCKSGHGDWFFKQFANARFTQFFLVETSGKSAE